MFSFGSGLPSINGIHYRLGLLLLSARSLETAGEPATSSMSTKAGSIILSKGSHRNATARQCESSYSSLALSKRR
jgi:hypothetical protein